MPKPGAVFDLVGGLPFFEELVDRFYDRVESDAVLLSVYPDPAALGPARRRLALFLAQYWGGPPIYSEERGHPRLRMRHFAFTIGTTERDLWLQHINAAVREMEVSPEIERMLHDYFAMGAESVRNRD